MNYKAEVLEIRKQREVSVTKLSKLTGIPADRIYKWESGVGNPKADDSEKLQKWLNGSSSNHIPAVRPQEPQHGDKSEILEIMRERVKELKEDKERLWNTLESSLIGLSIQGKQVLATVSVILEKDNERDAQGNKKKEQALKDDTDKRIGDKFSAPSQTDNSLNRQHT